MDASEKRGWPIIRITGNAAANHKLPDQPIPADLTVFETYVPESAPNVLTVAEARLFADMLRGNPKFVEVFVDLIARLSAFAEGKTDV